MTHEAYAIRPFRAGDEARLAEICVRTGARGDDASGQHSADTLLPELFVLPYVARHPDFAFVADGPNGVVGYIVAAPDTDGFWEWFRAMWWPDLRSRYVSDAGVPDPRDADLIAYADGRRPGVDPLVSAHPAHLHIDLLPEAQGLGLGRALIFALVARLREAGVPALHLVADAANAGAVAFYSRVGFTPLASGDGERAFGMTL